MAIIFWSLWSIFNKISLHTLHPAMVQIVSAISFLLMIPLYFYLLPKEEVRFPVTSGIIWAFFAAVATSIATIAYMHAVSKAEVSLIISTTSIHPLLTFFIAVIFLGETFTFTKFIGTCCILIGVWTINR